jgi:hypothetical protein
MKRQDYVYLGFASFEPRSWTLTLTNRFYELNEAADNFVALMTTDFISELFYQGSNTFPNTITTFNRRLLAFDNGTITTWYQYKPRLIGNPYQLTISADAFPGSNTIGTLYFWFYIAARGCKLIMQL